ncbi:MOCS3 [Mytilus edulis]|uniref:Adenylyltransferase and sulfurtransferase MOCS3 homolog n=1 Tax=Mytilus edulis TaxID=6550 RepID=A0A8S3UJI6_MYTED|nr:MOCS3 [Mytilus edulis]
MIKHDIADLQKQINEKQMELDNLKEMLNTKSEFRHPSLTVEALDCLEKSDNLSNEQIGRYSRQLILPEIGVKGQLSLSSKSVLIVGAGGLGCPSAVYLAAAGVGRIGIVDYDEVELNNLHRQILHTEKRVGTPKSSSVASSCTQLNSLVECIPYHLQLDSTNALRLIKQYDVVLDATDNVATRYLLNDACILANKPLVSGSALRFEGQLTVYNYEGGPCYRCLYPKPPPPETVTNCSDGGVLGVSSFRSIKIRGRQPTCPVCGDNPTITELIDYEQFCGARANDKDKDLTLLEDTDRISPKDYKEMLDNKQEHVLVDVRLPVELDICQLPVQSYNLPMNSVDKKDCIQALEERLKCNIPATGDPLPVVVACRRGNDSQIVTQKLKDKFKDLNLDIKDLKGGLLGWTKHVDKNFPIY